MIRFIYQHDGHLPPWCFGYELDDRGPYSKWLGVHVTLYSEQLDDRHGRIYGHFSAKSSFDLATEIGNWCKQNGVTFTDTDFNQVEFEFRRYF